jgi:hypothetical protein
MVLMVRRTDSITASAVTMLNAVSLSLPPVPAAAHHADKGNPKAQQKQFHLFLNTQKFFCQHSAHIIFPFLS